jgi:hypothetical protein
MMRALTVDSLPSHSNGSTLSQQSPETPISEPSWSPSSHIPAGQHAAEQSPHPLSLQRRRCGRGWLRPWWVQTGLASRRYRGGTVSNRVDSGWGPVCSGPFTSCSAHVDIWHAASNCCEMYALWRARVSRGSTTRHSTWSRTRAKQLMEW